MPDETAVAEAAITTEAAVEVARLEAEAGVVKTALQTQAALETTAMVHEAARDEAAILAALASLDARLRAIEAGAVKAVEELTDEVEQVVDDLDETQDEIKELAATVEGGLNPQEPAVIEATPPPKDETPQHPVVSPAPLLSRIPPHEQRRLRRRHK